MIRSEVLWSRAPHTAFVDDGERIVLLDLGNPPGRPRLLQGAAAAVWRSLRRPVAPSDLIRELEEAGYSSPGTDATEAVLAALSREGLARVAPDLRS